MTNTTYIPLNTRISTSYPYEYYNSVNEAVIGKPPKQSFREKVFGKKIDVRALNKSLI